MDDGQHISFQCSGASPFDITYDLSSTDVLERASKEAESFTWYFRLHHRMHGRLRSVRTWYNTVFLDNGMTTLKARQHVRLHDLYVTPSFDEDDMRSFLATLSHFNRVGTVDFNLNNTVYEVGSDGILCMDSSGNVAFYDDLLAKLKERSQKIERRADEDKYKFYPTPVDWDM